MKIFETIERNDLNTILGGQQWQVNTSGTRLDGTCYTDHRDLTGENQNDPDFTFDSKNYDVIDVPCPK